MRLDHQSPIWHPFTQHGLGDRIPLIARGEGARLYDAQGNSWIDAISSWWVTTHGHAHPRIMAAIRDHCREAPEFVCEVLRVTQSPLVDGPDGAGVFLADPRLRAAVVAAPGLGFTFAHGGLEDVAIPVQVWSGDRDTSVPYASNTGIVEQALGARAESHRMAGASHVSFLAPCGLLGPPAFCRDGEGFDREAAHQAMNASILAFFDRTMPKAAPR